MDRCRTLTTLKAASLPAGSTGCARIVGRCRKGRRRRRASGAGVSDPTPDPSERTTLLTLGHGSLDEAQLASLLRDAEVQMLVDIRRFPASRAHPHVRREALEEWLAAHAMSYRWEPRLGGRRRLPEDSQSPDVWWTVEAFRAYASHTRTAEFLAGFNELVEQARRCTVAIMCSETVWWRCHRRLVADVAVLAHGVQVLHLMPGGRPRPHLPAEGARLCPDGTVIWDGAEGQG